MKKDNSATGDIKQSVSKITCKDGSVYEDYFQHFDDQLALKQKGEFRFVLSESSSVLMKEYKTTGKLNKKHSIIINLSNVDIVENEKPLKISDIHCFK